MLNRPPWSIYLFVHEKATNSPLFYKTMVHEIEHAFQVLDASSETHSVEKLQYYHEVGAQRAEWEYLQMLPRVLRVKITEEHSRVDAKDRDADLAQLLLVDGKFSNYKAMDPVYSTLESTTRQYRRSTGSSNVNH